MLAYYIKLNMFHPKTTVNCCVCVQEMKNQCFGGEYMGEVFDHMLKR